MAGIGFELKKMFRNESYSGRTKAYLYSALVAAGPWLAAVVTVNTIIFIMEFILQGTNEKELFMGTIVYSFVFSQIVTAPWQLLLSRYVADKLYCKEYQFIAPSFNGVTKVLLVVGIAIIGFFYSTKPLPLAYKLMSGYLFLILIIIWIIMVYLSAVKDYQLIAKAYIYGGVLSIVLTVLFVYSPVPFSSLSYASNLLFAYLAGLTLTLLILVYNFISTFHFGNSLEFDFLRYLDKFPSLFFIGLFYVGGLWIDDLVMWFSPIAVEVNGTYLYAPIYDNAVFLSYLTIIPTMVLFVVSVETEFYEHYKKYYELANKIGTLEEIELAKNEMKENIYRKLLQTFQIQALISITIFLLAKPLFQYFNFSILIREIFRITVLGALFNILAFIIILVLLYFEVRNRALITSLVFILSNFLGTKYFLAKGIDYYGYGFLLGSLITLIVAIIFLKTFMNRLNYRTFALQPIFSVKEKGIFIKIADTLNKIEKYSNKNSQHERKEFE